MNELEQNLTLRICVQVCETLGIDDPICWMNSVDDRVIDLWAAWFIYQSKDNKQMQPAEQALARLVETWHKT